MAFSRKNISTTSTFSRNGAVVETVNFPLQRVWNSTSDINTKTWDLGQNWSLTTSATDLKFKFQGASSFNITTAGVSLSSLNLFDNSYTPATSGFIKGDLVKISGELHVLDD